MAIRSFVYTSQRKPVRLGDQVGQGGESIIYRVKGQSDCLVKIYTTPHISVYQRKLTWMLDHPPTDPTASSGHITLAWPLAMLYDPRGSFVGYLMPFIQNATTLLQVFNPRLRVQTLPGFDRRYLHRAARNLALALASLHAHNYVVGDLHESNVMVTPSALVTLIDTDSFQVEVEGPDGLRLYPCIVGKPEYTPPELQGKSFRQVKRLPQHDCFGLGVIIFQMLMEGNHPFRGQWLGPGDPPPLEEKIRWGLFPYVKRPRGPVAPPPTGMALETLHPELVALVQRCFVDGHARPELRPTPSQWEQALSTAETCLVPCTNGHYYSNHLPACPACRTRTAARRRPRPRPVALRRLVPTISPLPRPGQSQIRPLAQPTTWPKPGPTSYPWGAQSASTSAAPSSVGGAIVYLLRAWISFFFHPGRAAEKAFFLLLASFACCMVVNTFMPGTHPEQASPTPSRTYTTPIWPTASQPSGGTPLPTRTRIMPTLTPHPAWPTGTPAPTNTLVPTFTPRPPTPTSPLAGQLLDLIVTEIVYEDPFIVVYYMDRGSGVLNQGLGQGQRYFPIKISSLETGKSFEGLAPLPGRNRVSGVNFLIGEQLGLEKGKEYTISVEIDWENQLSESDKRNNLLRKRIRVE